MIFHWCYLLLIVSSFVDFFIFCWLFHLFWTQPKHNTLHCGVWNWSERDKIKMSDKLCPLSQQRWVMLAPGCQDWRLDTGLSGFWYQIGGIIGLDQHKIYQVLNHQQLTITRTRTTNHEGVLKIFSQIIIQCLYPSINEWLAEVFVVQPRLHWVC